MLEYKIVQVAARGATPFKKLEEAVGVWIMAGWVPLGGPTHSISQGLTGNDEYMYQAMTREIKGTDVDRYGR